MVAQVPYSHDEKIIFLLYASYNLFLKTCNNNTNSLLKNFVITWHPEEIGLLKRYSNQSHEIDEKHISRKEFAATTVSPNIYPCINKDYVHGE